MCSSSSERYRRRGVNCLLVKTMSIRNGSVCDQQECQVQLGGSGAVKVHLATRKTRAVPCFWIATTCADDHPPPCFLVLVGQRVKRERESGTDAHSQPRPGGKEQRRAIRFCDRACAWCLGVVLMRVLLERERGQVGLGASSSLSSASASVGRPDDWTVTGVKKKKPKQLAAKRHGIAMVRNLCPLCSLSVRTNISTHPSIPKAFSLVKDDTMHTYTLHTDGQIPWHA